MIIMKFGGSSVADSSAISRVCNIIATKSKDQQVHVVTSALGGVTDLLLQSAHYAAEQNIEYEALVSKIRSRHINAIKELIPFKLQSNVLAVFQEELNKLEDALTGIYLIRELTNRTLDFVMSFGERFAAIILSQALSNKSVAADYLDARKIIRTDDHFQSARIDFTTTRKLINEYFQDRSAVQVVTGFISSTDKGETTTIGRGGSDYTASILAEALGAETIEVWSDVDGVMTANPKRVPNAFTIPEMTYEEAMEMSHFGAKVIFPPTMRPAMQADIPIIIKNTFNPDHSGTRISSKRNDSQYTVRGLTSIPDIALITIKGSGMVGVTGVASRIFSSLAAKEINVILITQASSEYAVCVAVMNKEARAARQIIESEFDRELADQRVSDVEVEEDMAIIAAVGDKMRRTPGIAARVFDAFGQNGINIIAIAQGSSELNISVVIKEKDASKALNALHNAFFLAGSKTLHLFQVGTGLIGSTILELLAKQKEKLLKEYQIDIRVSGLANSRKMLFDIDGIPPDQWEEKLDKNGESTNLDEFLDRVKKHNLSYGIFLDCTASQDVANRYDQLLDSSISVITPNKKANSAEYSYYKCLHDITLKRGVKYLYETNVGAGLPIIENLRHLVGTGDKIKRIEGILSGTLSYIFNSFDGSKPFSAIVKEAREKGYTEPDPREDLNGMDMGRKLLILGREAGYIMQPDDIEIENLVPEEARDEGDIDHFFNVLEKYDDHFAELIRQAENENKLLRYTAKFEDGKGKVGLEKMDKDHPFAATQGSDNIVVITSEHYVDRPLTVIGPGAGAYVTSSGVISDILKIGRYG